MRFSSYNGKFQARKQLHYWNLRFPFRHKDQIWLGRKVFATDQKTEDSFSRHKSTHRRLSRHLSAVTLLLLSPRKNSTGLRTDKQKPLPFCLSTTHHFMSSPFLLGLFFLQVKSRSNPIRIKANSCVKRFETSPRIWRSHRDSFSDPDFQTHSTKNFCFCPSHWYSPPPAQTNF